MSLLPFIRPWSGSGYRHIPERAASPIDRRALALAGIGEDNRWNAPGEPTLYLASDPGVAVAEWGRHFGVVVPSALAPSSRKRRLFRLTVELTGVLDLRQPEVCAELDLADDLTWCLDRDLSRSVAAFVRRATVAVALIVPSVCFLDDRERGNIVLFLDRLPSEPSSYVRAVEPAGFLTAEP